MQYAYLTDRLPEARRLIQEATAQRGVWQERAGEAYRAAQADLEAQNLVSAMVRLEEIPASVRGEAFNQLYQEVRPRFEKLRAVEREIARAVQDRDTDGLLPRVQELLELQPDHVQGLALAQLFARRLERSAQERLAEGKYREALAVLDDIPPPARDEHYAGLRQKMAELAWLSEDLRLAPAVDRPLVAIAARFKKLCARRRPGRQAGRGSAPPGGADRQEHANGGAALGQARRSITAGSAGGLDDRLSPHRHPGGPRVARLSGAAGPLLRGLRVGLARAGAGPAAIRLAGHRRADHVGPHRQDDAPPLGPRGLGAGPGLQRDQGRAPDLDEVQGRIAVQACETIEYRKPLSQAGEGLETQTVMRDALDLLREAVPFEERPRRRESARGHGAAPHAQDPGHSQLAGSRTSCRCSSASSFPSCRAI